MSAYSQKVASFASLKSSEAWEIAREFENMIIGNAQLRIDFIDAGIIPVALQKFEESEDAESRLIYARLLWTMTAQKSFQSDSQYRDGIGRARKELRELGALFVILRVLRLDKEHNPDLWLLLSNTMIAVLDRVSLPFNEVAVPWLVSQLERYWAPWEVFCCASMLRSCLGIKGKHAPAAEILEHAYSAGCLPVLIAKLFGGCGHDGNQPIASILKALTRLTHIGYTALGLNAVPVILANIASPEPMPSSFIDPQGEWSDELGYHQTLVCVLKNFVRSRFTHATAASRSLQMQGTLVLLRENCIRLFASRLWCKNSSKLLLNMAENVDEAESFQDGFMNPVDCEHFFLEYAQVLMTKLAYMTSSASQFDAAQHIKAHEWNELATARDITALSKLSRGKKAILECNGGVTMIVQFLKLVLHKEAKLDAPMSSRHLCMGTAFFAVSMPGASLLHNVLSTLLNLVKVRRGTKGAVAAGVFHAINPVFFATTVLNETGIQEQEESQRSRMISELHAVAAEILARISSITKGQRQAITVAPTILNALCADVAENTPFLNHLVDVLGNIASTEDGLSVLAFCNAAPVFQNARELVVRKQSTPETVEERIELAGKLHTLHTLVKSQQAQVSDFSDLVSGSCARAASTFLDCPEDGSQVKLHEALVANVCSFAVAIAKQGPILRWLNEFAAAAFSSGALLGCMIQRMGVNVGVTWRNTILKYCISKKFNRLISIRLLGKTFGSAFADECISIQRWIEYRALTVAAARMIHRVLEAQQKEHSAEEKRSGHLPIEEVTAHLKAHIKLPTGCEASMIARSAVSIFSPPLAMLGIGEGGSEMIVLCQHSAIVPLALPSSWSEQLEHFNQRSQRARAKPSVSPSLPKPRFQHDSGASVQTTKGSMAAAALPQNLGLQQSPNPHSAQSTAHSPLAPHIRAAPLPSGWIQRTTTDGRVYYYNEITHQTQWNVPAASRNSELPDGWQQQRDPQSGLHYYVCLATGKATQERPSFAAPPPSFAAPPPSFAAPPPTSETRWNTHMCAPLPQDQQQRVPFAPPPLPELRPHEQFVPPSLPELQPCQQFVPPSLELQVPVSHHEETEVVSDEHESQMMLNVWAKLIKAAQRADADSS